MTSKTWEFTSTCPYEGIEKEYALCSYPEPFCEHCYDLEPFEFTVTDGIDYCLNCVTPNELCIPEDIMAKAEKWARKAKIKFYEQKLKELKNS